MELDEIEVSCFKSGRRGGHLRTGTAYHGKPILRKPSSQSIRGTTQLERASPEHRPLFTVCSINSAIDSSKSHHSWPRQVSVLLLDWGQTI